MLYQGLYTLFSHEGTSSVSVLRTLQKAEVYVVTVLELFAKTKCEGLCNGPDASEAEHVL